MIRVCPTCSNVNIDDLKEIVPENKLYIGCIAKCKYKSNKSMGFINDIFFEKESSNEFIKEVKRLI